MKLLTTVVVGFMLLSPARAYAECAWVLWMKETRLDYRANTEERSWQVAGAAVNHETCDALLAHEITTVTPRQTAPKVYSGVDFLQLRADKAPENLNRVQRFDYFCLPDTVDPRGPKGDRR
jgi:hypothetical protein